MFNLYLDCYWRSAHTPSIILSPKKVACMTNRVHIDAPAGVIDLEGEKEFVEGMLAKLFPLIENAGFGRHPKSIESEAVAEPEAELDNVPTENGSSTNKARTRKAGKKPPAGHSCGERILKLKEDGFFKEKKSSAEIVAGLKAKGWTHNTSQVGAAAGPLFNKGDLQRTNEGGGWLYFWDRG